MIRKLIAVVLVVLLAGTAGASAQTQEWDNDGDGVANERDVCPERSGPREHEGCSVVNKRIVRPPKREKVRREFTPDAEPSPSKVGKIEKIEQERWGGPSIARRVYCESRNVWSATNGQYRGLLQIGSWWSYAYPRTPRKVVVRNVQHRQRSIFEIKRWGNGDTTKKRIGKRHQRLLVKRVGKLPSGASPYHGWAAIRVGQRAVSGDGPTTYWQCGL